MPDEVIQLPAQPGRPSAPPPRRNLRLVQAATLVIVIAAVASTVWLHGHEEFLRRVAHSPFALPALFILSILSSATLFLPVPGLAITALLGALFNPLVVGIVAGVGQTLGEITGYVAGYSGQSFVERSSTYKRLEGWMRHNEILGEGIIFLLALIPNPFFDAAGVAAGALRFPLWKYLLVVGCGKLLKNIAFAYSGELGLDWLFRLWGASQALP